MRLRPQLLVVLFFCSPAFGQIDFSRYMEDNFALPLLDIRDHVPVKIKWDMKGTIQADLNEGLNQLDEGYPHQAIASFDSVIAADSSSWIPYYFRGICKKQLNDFKSSETDFKHARKLGPSQAEICVELGELYQLNRQPKMATDLYKEAIQLNPALAISYYNLGGVSFQAGDLGKAFNYYAKCNEVDPHFPQSYMIQGVIRFKKKKNDNSSIQFFNQALVADSTYSRTYFWRGLAYLNQNQSDKCIADWNQLVRYNPENSFYILMRGFLHAELGNFDLAFTDLRKALRAKEVNENRFEAQQTLLDKQIDLQNAADYVFASGYGMKKDSAIALLKKGFCLLLVDKNKPAILALLQAGKLEPSAPIYYCLGVAYEHIQEHNAAFICYDKALSLDPDIFDAHKKRGIYRFELKSWKGAYQDFDEMLRLQPGTPIAYRLRGLVKSNEGDYRGAIEDLTRFLASDSTDLEVLRTRSVCREFVGDKKGSLADAWRMWELSPLDENGSEVAKGFLALNDTATAITAWKKIAAKTNSPYAYAELSRIYFHQENWDSLSLYVGVAAATLTPAHGANQYSDVVAWSGLVDFRKGAYHEAIDKLSDAIKSNRNNVLALYFRARALLELGETSKALADLRKVKGYRDSEALIQNLQKR